MMDPVDHALLVSVRHALAVPFRDPVELSLPAAALREAGGGGVMPRKLARQIERGFSRLALIERRRA